jgi:hypothetical protein
MEKDIMDIGLAIDTFTDVRVMMGSLMRVGNGA